MINKNTRIIIQGITGHHGSFHANVMKKYGTKVVAGVTPGKEGKLVHNIPVYNTVKKALKHHKADWSMIFVPAKYAKNAALEALKENLNIIIITEHVPVHDALEIIKYAKKKKRKVIGPNSPGMISPGKCKTGIMPHKVFKKGNIGVMSRSGTLTYEIVNELTKSGHGQSLCIGIGGDPIIGTTFIDALRYFQKDRQTKKIVIVGEIGGDAEEKAAKYIKKYVKKKVVAYIAGKSAPKGKRMGHAGAIISGTEGTAEAKTSALTKVGVKIAELPKDLPKLLR